MLSSEFSQEMGALLRSLADRVRQEPDLKDSTDVNVALSELDRAIVRLVSLRLHLSTINLNGSSPGSLG